MPPSRLFAKARARPSVLKEKTRSAYAKALVIYDIWKYMKHGEECVRDVVLGYWSYSYFKFKKH